MALVHRCTLIVYLFLMSTALVSSSIFCSQLAGRVDTRNFAKRTKKKSVLSFLALISFSVLFVLSFRPPPGAKCLPAAVPSYPNSFGTKAPVLSVILEVHEKHTRSTSRLQISQISHQRDYLEPSPQQKSLSTAQLGVTAQIAGFAWQDRKPSLKKRWCSGKSQD